MSRQQSLKFIDPETIDLSDKRCDLRGLTAEAGAKKFYAFLCEIAELIGTAAPIIYPPGSRDEAGDNWWVIWEDCPWPEWAITGGGWVKGPLAGWESLRNGVHYPKPELGPFFQQDHSGPWYIQPYWGFDAIFWANG